MSSSEPGNPAQDFASLWESLSDSYAYVNPRRGDIRDGTILSVRPSEIILDIGSKEDAFVASREVERMSPDELAALHEGDTIKVYVLRFDRNTEALLVSLRMAAEEQDWLDAQEAMEAGELLTVTVSGYNKGGLLAQYKGLQGFLPASQVLRLSRRALDESPSDALGAFIGRELIIKIIEVHRQRRRLILSERAAAREWRDQQREELLAAIVPGEIRTGIVSNLVDFGAFVDLGGIDGLVHISELSWGRVDRPGQVLRPGDEVQVMVLSVDQERQRIALSIKRTLADPWFDVEERYQPGQIVEGVVTHLVKFGAFVELEPGVEGLVHISELTEQSVADPLAGVEPGDQLSLVVLGVDGDRHRISLSLRQAEEIIAEEAHDEPRAMEQTPEAPEGDAGSVAPDGSQEMAEGATEPPAPSHLEPAIEDDRPAGDGGDQDAGRDAPDLTDEAA